MGKALIKVGYSCNNNCLFCHSKFLRRYNDLSYKEIIEKIEMTKEMGIDMVVFSGGEPTIRKDLLKLIKFTSIKGMKSGIITNGRILSYKENLNKLVENGLEYIFISVLGSNEKLHNKQTQTDSFFQTVKALENIKNQPVEFIINIVVNKLNEKDLKQIVRFIVPYLPLKVKFSLVEPKGAALENFKNIVPSYRDAAIVVMEAIEFGNDISKGQTKFCCDGFTPCLIAKYDELKDDLFTNNFVIMSEVFEDKFYPVDYGNRLYAKICFECFQKKNCPGVYREYINSCGEKDIKPIVKLCSNSFNFLPVVNNKKWMIGSITQNLKILKETGCKLGEINNLNPVRQIFVSYKNVVNLFETDTGDFNDEEIKRTKFIEGQIYLDKSNKYFDINFRKDLVKLNLCKKCRKCIKNPFSVGFKTSVNIESEDSTYNGLKLKNNLNSCCPCLFEPAKEDVFADMEENIRRILTRIKGNILDIGFCNSPYLDVISYLIIKGLIRYVGIDPSAKNQKSEIRNQKLVKCNIENFKWESEHFDFILVFRSYNHFYDLYKALDNIYKLLKPKGKLLVVENTKYGLVRSREHRNLNGGEEFFRHYRNHNSEEAIKRLKYYGYKIKKHFPVKRNGCNQWLLLLEK